MFRLSLSCVALWALLNSLTLVHSDDTPHSTSKQLHARQAVHRPNPLRNFEVRQPPSVPKSKPCEVVILEHTFITSWGKPANTSYSPPRGCGRAGSWASVIFNLTATSVGTQYDRLGMLYLNDIEVWRTSTAEPTKEGIIWTVTRDMSKYTPLLSRPATFSLDIGNTVDPLLDLTGNFEVTLSAKFYPPTPEFPASKKADRIINMGRGTGNNMTSFLSFPRNVATAYLDLFASGSGKEEFWYTNVPDAYTPQLDPANTGAATGKGSHREVQVWIDNFLAGVAYPFPVIYTGGMLLTWWRPIAAIGAFDAPTYTIDISPFVPLLSDSKPHNFTIFVEGQGEKGSINQEWLFSASVFISLDPTGVRTTGRMLTYLTDSKTTVDVPKEVRIPPNMDPKSLISFATHSFRKLEISSNIVTGTKGAQVVKVEQDMTFINQQSWGPGAAYQSVVMSSKGNTISTHGDVAEKIDEFRYPFNLTLSALSVPPATKVVGHLNHKYSRTQIFPLCPTLGKINIETTQDCAGELLLNGNGRALSGLGRTIQSFTYKDGKGGTYARDVDIYNSTKTIRDRQSGTLLPVDKAKVLGELSLSDTSLGTSLLSTENLSTNGASANDLPANAFSTSAIGNGPHLAGDKNARGAPGRLLHTPPPSGLKKSNPQ
ncbi:hypothetical protein Pst134EB_012656 [Puccinia striiformis f. sp. tritici]|uniref:Peptide N-acetyl-beta-D-glucosaminyl asparaginase amidase A N-terminal domain-containing protein n=1 Tax=Puccinia striiformis f. sp. tritici PST-78 TaxID=1165861 RepID=A0A0L0V7K7_9BASI|nr:hypothetical protein Pst134EB_012656 [Puccinia striiformis f. sp. tritici]KNE95263.1 hypothetical protein PSTG_11434 [Puccinia striiformis f. sp. tritici PST-78]